MKTSRLTKTGDHNGFGLRHVKVLPGPRTVFHVKNVVMLILFVLGVILILSFFGNATHKLRIQNCSGEEETLHVEKIVEAQKLWFKDELNNVVIRIANLSRRIDIHTDPGRDDQVKVDGDNAAVGEFEGEDFESNSIDHKGIDKEYAQNKDGYAQNNDDYAHNNDDYAQNNDVYAQINDGNDMKEEEQQDDDDDLSVNINDKEQVAELKLWKKMEKENLYGIFKNLRKILNGTIEKNIPAPGTIAHDVQRPLTILSSVNAGFLDFAVNWLMSMKQIGIRHNLTLIAEDPIAYDYLSKRYRRSSTISIIPTKKNYTNPNVLGFFSRDYLKLVNRRADYILQFLEKGIDVLHVDVDEYWFRDPLTFIRAEYDIYDVWSAQGKDGPCPCFLYLKAKPNVIHMVKDWSLRMKRKHGSENDQVSLAQVLWRHRVMQTGNKNKIYHRKLEHDLFPTGTVFLTPSWWRTNGKRLYVAHANRLGNHKKKTAFFREYRLWLVNPYTLDLPAIPEE